MDPKLMKGAAAGGAAVAVAAYLLSLWRGSNSSSPFVAKPAGTASTSAPSAEGGASTTDSGLVAAASGSGGNVYETAKAVSEYLLFHYGTPEDILPYDCGPKSALEFPRRTAEICERHCRTAGLAMGRALDVGCAVGAASFHLSKFFEEVVGVDFSHAFVAAANSMKTKGSASYTMVMESDITESREARVPEGLHRERCAFQQGDACNLPSSLGKFSVIHAANLLCRLPNPRAFLESLDSLLVDGGFVVLVSPYSWMVGYTERAKWVGGFVEDGKPHYSSKGLTDIMEARFRLVEQGDVPFLIREHARKFQWGCSHLTVWQKR